MKKNNLINKLFLFATVLSMGILASCEDLEVENFNSPNQSAVLGTPNDFPALIDGQFGTMWQGLQLSQPNFPISVMAQGPSMSWGNWGARDLGTIPRAAMQNTLNYSNRGLFTAGWNGLYAALSTTTTALKILAEENATITDASGNDITAQTIANGKFIQGMTLGYLSLLYDQAYIIDENTDLGTLDFSPYGDVNDAAIAKLNEAAAAFAGSSSMAMTGWFGLTYTGTQAANLIRSFIAKFEAAQARNTTEASAVDWNTVLTNSANPVEVAPIGDGGNTWWHRLLIQGQDAGWARVSQKVIKMMNPSKPSSAVPYPWPDGANSFPRITAPDDARVDLDFSYTGSNDFSAARGYYFYSNYDYSRYEAYRAGFTEPMMFLSTDETNLLRAEALIRTGGNKVTAAGLINNTRVGRGGLAPLTGAESDADLLNAILYERIVEFTWHGSCNVWFYRRMMTPPNNADAANLYYLEPGTARHLPVPAAELTIFGRPLYTFGGVAGEQ